MASVGKSGLTTADAFQAQFAHVPRMAQANWRILMQTRVMRRPEVLKIVGLSRATIYQMMAEGRFPKPIKVGLRAVAWREADIEAWLASREAA
jgi:prophage regulatory protein